MHNAECREICTIVKWFCLYDIHICIYLWEFCTQTTYVRWHMTLTVISMDFHRYYWYYGAISYHLLRFTIYNNSDDEFDKDVQKSSSSFYFALYCILCTLYVVHCLSFSPILICYSLLVIEWAPERSSSTCFFLSFFDDFELVHSL